MEFLNIVFSTTSWCNVSIHKEALPTKILIQIQFFTSVNQALMLHGANEGDCLHVPYTIS